MPSRSYSHSAPTHPSLVFHMLGRLGWPGRAAFLLQARPCHRKTGSGWRDVLLPVCFLVQYHPSIASSPLQGQLLPVAAAESSLRLFQHLEYQLLHVPSQALAPAGDLASEIPLVLPQPSPLSSEAPAPAEWCLQGGQDPRPSPSSEV